MVLCSGAFDGLHGGHVAYLEAAKALCEGDELLVCAIAPDEYIQVVKGRAQHWSQPERLRTVRALGCVDAAIAQRQLSIASLINEHRPRLFIKGPDWEGRLPEDVRRACSDVGTSIGYVDTPGVHVSDTRISDDEALAQFESLVLTQKPADTPWQPVTDYSFETRTTVEGPHPQLIKDVLQPGQLLDYGCGYGHLVRLLRELDVKAFGFDPFIEPADAVGSYVFGRTPYGLADEDWDVLGGDWDVIVCREVLEHCTVRQLYDLVKLLTGLQPRVVYLTTRFAKHAAHFLSVDTVDDLDPTHISMTNQHWLRHVFVLEGFRRRADLEEQMDWKKLGRCLVYERT